METDAADVGASSDEPQIVPTELTERLRDALQIKNLTAIKAVANKLIDDPATKHVGEQIWQHAAAFDFLRLTTLLDEMEKHRGNSR